MTPKRTYTRRYVSELFGVDSATIWRWTRAGKLPVAIKTLGGQYRYDADAIDKIIEDGTAQLLRDLAGEDG